ncbi:MAG: hypothetical protein Q8M29_01290 [Bacteroidota bacterium]|nr:hypothetical protein [Bacteroidota bacterium]
MFKDLTYQKKLKLLAPLAIVALLLVYFLGIKKTISLRSEIKEKQEKLIQAKDIDTKVSLIRSKLKKIDNLIGSDMDSSSKVIDVILEDITTYCSEQGCTLRDIPLMHEASDNNFDIETYFITVEGSYKQLLNLVYLLEQKKKSGGRLSSCLLYSKKNNATKKLSLEATLYIQQYNKK